AASWQAAYQGLIPPDILGRLTSPRIVTARADAMRERWPEGVLIAEIGHGSGAQPGTGAPAAAELTAVGVANFGRERGPHHAPRRTRRPRGMTRGGPSSMRSTCCRRTGRLAPGKHYCARCSDGCAPLVSR